MKRWQRFLCWLGLHDEENEIFYVLFHTETGRCCLRRMSLCKHCDKLYSRRK